MAVLGTTLSTASVASATAVGDDSPSDLELTILIGGLVVVSADTLVYGIGDVVYAAREDSQVPDIFAATELIFGLGNLGYAGFYAWLAQDEFGKPEPAILLGAIAFSGLVLSSHALYHLYENDAVRTRAKTSPSLRVGLTPLDGGLTERLYARLKRTFLLRNRQVRGEDQA